MEDQIKVKIKVRKGAVKVNFAVEHISHEDLKTIIVDLGSKYAEVVCYTGGDEENPGLYVSANSSTLNLDKKFDRDEPTRIEFLKMKGWDIWSTTIFKYSLRVCLYKTKE